MLHDKNIDNLSYNTKYAGVKKINVNDVENLAFSSLKLLVFSCLFSIAMNTAFLVLTPTSIGGRLYNVVTDTEDTSALLIKHGQLRRRYVMIPLNKIRSNVIDRFEFLCKFLSQVGGFLRHFV